MVGAAGHEGCGAILTIRSDAAGCAAVTLGVQGNFWIQRVGPGAAGPRTGVAFGGTGKAGVVAIGKPQHEQRTPPDTLGQRDSAQRVRRHVRVRLRARVGTNAASGGRIA